MEVHISKIMDYEERWKVLESLLKYIIDKGKTVPKDLLKDLRSTKTLIQIYKVKPDDPENVRRIEEYLNNVESQLIFKIQMMEGEDSAKRWMKKLEKTKKSTAGKPEECLVSKAVYGVPRNKKWVRIKLDEGLTEEKVVRDASEFGLNFRVDGDKRITVFGDAEKIKSFIKKMASHRS
ncbi:MAG: DUF2096 family protein [Candidatus Bathyarchaeia archaeon]